MSKSQRTVDSWSSPKGKTNKASNKSRAGNGAREGTRSRGAPVTKRGRKKGDPRFTTFERRELWFTINNSSSGVKRFESGGFPLWFNSIARLYEHYQLNYLRFKFETTYSALSTGACYVTYNTNPNQEAEHENVSIMQSQLGAVGFQVAKSKSITIPTSAITRTPSKKPTEGEGSYSFDIGYKVDTSATGVFNVYIEYSVTFFTPQIDGRTTATETRAYQINGAARNSDQGATILRTAGTEVLRSVRDNINASVPINPGEKVAFNVVESIINSAAKAAGNNGEVRTAGVSIPVYSAKTEIRQWQSNEANGDPLAAYAIDLFHNDTDGSDSFKVHKYAQPTTISSKCYYDDGQQCNEIVDISTLTETSFKHVGPVYLVLQNNSDSVVYAGQCLGFGSCNYGGVCGKDVNVSY
nr:MAG: coat protein [Statovirus sp.]